MKVFSALVGFAALPLALADFHITTLYNSVLTSGTTQQHWTDYSACPSNYWNCKCLTNGDRRGRVDGKPYGDFFSVHNLCGMNQLNFYKRGDGHYDMYENNGNGKVIGTCYRNDGDRGKTCVIPFGSSYSQGGMVCYSYVCN